MNTESPARARISGPRLLGAAGALATVLALVLISSPNGASAAPGDADLALTKSDSPDPVVVGGTLTYTVQVENLDLADAATLVEVTDELSPSEVEFLSANSTSGTCQHPANTVTCSIGTINAATTATVTIVVKTKKSGTLSNTAAVTSPEDNTPANNQDTVTTLVTTKGKGNKQSCTSPTILGTAGNDVIAGTAGNDVIVTLDGNDQVSAGDGRDLVCVGRGSDVVRGGPRGDTVNGASGADRLIGNGGNDVLRGKSGRDRLRGRGGADLLDGGRGRDSCRGGAGADTLTRCP